MLALQKRLERIEVQIPPISDNHPKDIQDGNIDGLMNLKIGINFHLKDKERIAKRLGQAGVLGYSIFGVEEPPSMRTVSIIQGLPRDLERYILRIASELGFRSFNYIEPFEEIAEDVLFGSYGAGEYELIQE